MFLATNKLFHFSIKSKNIIFVIFLILIQGCTSSIEVAANLGKKYLIPKEEQKIIQKPIYKIGKKYNVGGKYYYPKKDLYYNKTGIASWYGPKFHGKLTANGEIYNHLEIRKYIQSVHNFNSWKSSSDTETLLNLFEFLEFKEALKLIKGMFALTLFDLKKNCIYFSRDRVGEKPLYISFNESSILFGSELISLTQFSSFNKDLSMSALSSFFKFNYSMNIRGCFLSYQFFYL